MDFPENAPAGSPCCILRHRLRLPLEPEQYEFLLHFAQGGVYAVVAGDSLILPLYVFILHIVPFLDLNFVLHLTNGGFSSLDAGEDVIESLRAHEEKLTKGLYLTIK
jgi:hypothetical protein